MRDELVEVLECPVCERRDFSFAVTDRDGREIREGYLTCRGCSRGYPIHKGIIDLLPDPSAVIRAEQKGWVEMLGSPPEAEMVDVMMRLPRYEGAIWETTADNFEHALDLVDLRGKRVLDVGAGRAWSSRHIMHAGAREVFALDILRERFIGLETAELYFEHDGIFFERGLADMHRLPVRDASYDVVFMTGTLHHSSDPGAVLEEVQRVLAPGGVALITNEPVASFLHSEDLENSIEVAHGINENTYSIWAYLRTARRAGLRAWFFLPRSIEKRLERDAVDELCQELGPQGYRIIARLWRSRWGRALLRRRLPLALAYSVASMPLVMVAFKR